MSKRKRTYRWFVEPFGDRANYGISQLPGITEDDVVEISPADAEDGHAHYVYECTQEERKIIENSVKEGDFQVHFWKQEGSGKYRKHDMEAVRRASRRNKEKKKTELPPLFKGTALETD